MYDSRTIYIDLFLLTICNKKNIINTLKLIL